MADRVFIIPLRSDLAGVGLNLGDLHPNAGQRNSIYDGTPQNNYIAEMSDRPGATVVSGVAYVSGSLTTTLAAAHNDIDDQTSAAAGAVNVSATQQTAFGLGAYIFDRVDPGGAGGAGTNPMTVAQANTMAAALVTIAQAGGALTLAAINTALSLVVATTDLDGAAANSDSFGTVREVLRIIAGEIYRLPLLTILGDASTGTSDFLGRVDRQVFVDAQLVTDVTTYGQFYAAGSFLDATDNGFRRRPNLVPTGSFNISNAQGVIAGYKAVTFNMLNSHDHAYAATAVTAWHPRAVTLAGANIPATGVGAAIGAYDHLGTAL